MTQKVFFNAYQGLSGFRQDASFKTWLYQIAVNACLNQIRQRRQPEVELDDSISGNQKGALSALIERERRDRVKQALETVPERQRIAVILRAYEGLDIAETAAVMGCSSGAVKAHYHQGIRKLKQILQEDGHEPVA